MLSLLFKLRKFLSLYSKTWKYICYLQIIKLYSSFLLNSYDDLLGSMGSILGHFDSLLTNKCGNYMILSRQFQKSIELLKSLLKNFLRSFNIVMECNWYKWTDILKIFLAAGIASVMIIIWVTSCKCIA